MNTGMTLWLYQYNYTGPRFSNDHAVTMRSIWSNSMARRAGFVPVAIAVDINAPDPQLTDDSLPLQRLRIPAGCAAYVLEHELES
jgi:hypothetical protein